jgi:hypothetical protein
MPTIISNFGNLNGPIPEQENKPEYIINALNKNFHVKTNIWLHNDKLFLGTFKPDYQVTSNFIREANLWMQCMDIETLQFITKILPYANFFFINNDNY